MFEVSLPSGKLASARLCRWWLECLGSPFSLQLASARLCLGELAPREPLHCDEADLARRARIYVHGTLLASVVRLHLSWARCESPRSARASPRRETRYFALGIHASDQLRRADASSPAPSPSPPREDKGLIINTRSRRWEWLRQESSQRVRRRGPWV